MVRLQKFLAEAGVASRRASEDIIRAGAVAINGQVVKVLGTKVDPVHDRVTVDGTRVKLKRKLYVALNKPRGYLWSRRAPASRRVVGDLLPKEWTSLYPVGRLDYDSEGLLFLTNDGDFCLRLTHPRYGVRKKYLATVEGKVRPQMLAHMERGIVHQEEKLRAEKTRLLSANHSHSVVEVEMAEGKYREVRRLFESQGLTVTQLCRTQIGRIKLGDLPVGKWRTLTAPEISTLLSNNNLSDSVSAGRH